MFESFKKKFGKALNEENGQEIRKTEIEDNIRTILLESDVSFDTAERIISDLENFISGSKKRVSMKDVKHELRASVEEILRENETDIDLLNPPKKPMVILFLGINGTGKTTTVAKIANYLKANNKRVVVAASDTFRAGAIEQLSILCDRIGVHLIRHETGSDPASVAFDAIEHAHARNLDFVLIDSAGRMQTNKNLLEEMKKMKRVAKPDLTVLVLDAMIGQDAVHQAETFNKETPFDAVILTKLDTDARGGAILTISDQLKKPILFVGVGQEMGDLQPFDYNWYLERIMP
ncbi:MAG: signal recognition particle-docking protein FtsY [Candidatus Thermoplasmatota archaeon]|jgi:fused signal recognition particle receptor|nr:signal recognition particle-docking protein FtsY [Candidatus Thermoplasmatota archaeon]MCL5955701.1 signal recognition particle-docking protein FtsY [Candidatus Thermoplasmatota archaeon]